jgi:ribosomal protein S12 methylthiotransferase accessory factor
LIASGGTRRRLDKILGLWDLLVDPRVGVVQRIEEGPIDNDDPQFFHYYSRSCDTAAFGSASNFRENGGVSTSRYVAIAKALGEAVERYCAAIYDLKDLPLARYRDLSLKAVHPSCMTVYREDQFRQSGFPWAPFTEDSLVRWTEGVSLHSGEHVLLPAAAVYLPFDYSKSPGTAPILQPISTGLACGASFEDAAVSGLSEAFERDAFAIMWQARMCMPRMLVASLPRSATDVVRRFETAGIDVELVNISSDFGVSTILSFALTRTTASPALAVAAATDLSPERAVIKSLEELAHTRKYSKRLQLDMAPLDIRADDGHPNVRGNQDHLRFYWPQFAKTFAEFAWSSPETCDFETLSDLSTGQPQKDLRVLVERAAAAGLDPIACDVTTSDIRSLGLRVVRVVVPGLHPLCMGHGNRALATRRLYEVPQKLGFRGLQRDEPDNPYPHPFP